ncbi:ISNCY family transposase [Candidatus Woesearchaeota archaeon]|nr:ISNCY family transposase [Candidatus Woesearchaeota archaeon]
MTPKRLIRDLKQICCEFPDLRKGKNSQYEMADAGMGAFSVFFTQCASFLAHQEEMKRRKGRSNAESLFEMVNIPSDNQIRELLDPVLPKLLAPIYRIIFERLEQSGIVDTFRSYSNSLLIAMDGTEYFSSQKIHCSNCSHRELANGKTNYFHSALTPVIVQAGNENVISLEPEFITPQDGHEKQDCEITAGKRWLNAHGAYYARRNATILGDDLYSRQPFCQALKDQKLHFILVCKPDSHPYLYESVAFLAAQGTLGTYQKRIWNGKHGEIYTYRYANLLPLHGGKDAMLVNWATLTITHEETGDVIYKNAFITDFEIRENNVEAIVRDGRARWKIENENNNILKTKGYHLEHNFGHGSQHLSSVLLSLNLLAFLFHTVMGLVDEKYRLLRQVLRKRQTFFQDVETLLRYFLFDSWDDLFVFMCKGLEIDTS